MSGEPTSEELRVDEFPSDPAVLAAMKPEERIAIYLNMIRRSLGGLVLLGFAFLILAVVSLLAR